MLNFFFHIKGTDHLGPIAGKKIYITDKNSTFPPNLHLLTLVIEYDKETLNTSSILVRLEHFYEIGEDSELSKPVQFDLQKLIGLISNFDFNIEILNVNELALGANMNISDLNERLKWNGQFNKVNHIFSKPKSMFTYEFQPMQIRTFRILLLKN